MDSADLEFRRLAFRPFLEGDKKEPRVGARDGAQEVEADDRGHILDAWSLQKQLLDAFGSLGCLLQGRCPWKLDHTEKIALVFLGNKRGGHGAADAACPERQRHKKKYGNRNLANQPSADGNIAICCGVEKFVEAPEERSQRSACLFARAEEERA